jgi:predicted nucleotidyltransferase
LISKAIINEAVKRLSDKFHPERIILFGSYARGTADDKSDVDLLVICPLRKKRSKLMAEMDRVLEGLRLPRDIVVISPKEFVLEKEIPGTIARYAWTEGKSLYEQNQRSN